ncbi:hypothetical protein LOR37_14170 [Clostridium estertheticum]|uniref:hypothetical protein n=1 Tax=Clostridium estertheticum TaxID=238834 RepID=UPI0022DDC73F|nr:hypothetical protein [Clostridium estertheticum]WBL45830.1 hypothetical protein LOR37_14170 [Clostridium estertheticum]
MTVDLVVYDKKDSRRSKNIDSTDKYGILREKQTCIKERKQQKWIQKNLKKDL